MTTASYTQNSTTLTDVTELGGRARGAERLREAFSSIPFYAARAAKNPDYWSSLYASQVNS